MLWCCKIFVPTAFSGTVANSRRLPFPRPGPPYCCLTTGISLQLCARADITKLITENLYKLLYMYDMLPAVAVLSEFGQVGQKHCRDICFCPVAGGVSHSTAVQLCVAGCFEWPKARSRLRDVSGVIALTAIKDGVPRQVPQCKVCLV